MGSEAVSPAGNLLSCLFFLDLSPHSARPQMACCPSGGWGWEGAASLPWCGLERRVRTRPSGALGRNLGCGVP